MASELEKHDKLKEKYAQLKQAYGTLKKGLLDKQEECSRLEQQVKEKETRLRQQIEEIDKLQYQNGRMSKQLGTLNSQVEELKQKTQQSSWSVGGLISGKPQQEAMQKAEEEIRVLRDHMEMKIQENEELHMKLFEDLRVHEEELQRVREEKTAAASELEKKSSDLDKERQQTGKLKGEAKQASDMIRSLEEELAKARASLEALQCALEGERREARRHVGSLEAKLSRWIPFDEGEHDPWNQWNVAPRYGREVLRRGQALQQLQASVGDACQQGAALLQLWSRTFGGPSGEETPARAQVRTKLCDSALSLASLLREAVPDMVGLLGAAQLRPSSSAVADFRKGSAAVLQAHRKWVAYQSMLLIYDWSASSAAAGTGRRGHEATATAAAAAPQALEQYHIGDSDSDHAEADDDDLLAAACDKARAVVEGLWQLHRSARALFAKLRLVTCLPLLVSRGASATHFGLAREALKKGGSQSSGAERLQRRGAAPARLLARVAVALGDASSAWEGLGRGLAALATAQVSHSEGSQQESASMPELLDSLHRFCGCMAERVMPALDQVAAEVPWAACTMSQRSSLAGVELASEPATPRRTGGAAAVAPASLGLNGFLHRAGVRLRQSPASIGFEESQQTLLLARRLSVEGSRAKGELRQQVERLQVATDEKAALGDQLRALQDKHELLRSNFQVLQDAAARRADEEPQQRSPPPPAAPAGAAAAAVVAPPVPAAPGPPGLPPGAGDLVLSSRQRALLESSSVTAQESAALRQHGFFVDVISLSSNEAALASGAPDAEASESWELAVRKVYEQHCRSLQAQVRAADGRAVDLQLSVQRCADLRRDEEEVKQQLRNEVRAKHAQLDSVKEDIATTRKNYDQQLAMLTEHICTLSVRISEKDDSLAALQAQKILCGHCGTWNPMGRLMNKEGGGTCKTCKEKVLSEGVA